MSSSMGDAGAHADARHTPLSNEERIAELEAQNTELRRVAVELQTAAEREGEFISNRLLKRIDELKAEKEKILLQVEREEEYLTNTLQKQLAKVKQEKIDLEAAMEREQELFVNRVQRQVDPSAYARRRSSSASANDLPPILASLLIGGSALSQAPDAPTTCAQPCPNEVEALKLRRELDAERRRAADLQERLDRLGKSSAKMFQSAEQEEEYIANRLMRRISELQEEKASLLSQLGSEEENINSMLSSRVSKREMDKQAMETALAKARAQIEKRVNLFVAQASQGAAADDAGEGSVAVTSAEVKEIRGQLAALQSVAEVVEENWRSKCTSLQNELQAALADGHQLRQRILAESRALKEIAESKPSFSSSSTPAGDDPAPRARSMSLPPRRQSVSTGSLTPFLQAARPIHTGDAARRGQSPQMVPGADLPRAPSASDISTS